MKTNTISGTFAIHPEGGDAYAVVIRDGLVVDVAERHMADTFRTAHDRRASLLEGIDSAVETGRETAAAVLTVVSEWSGEEMNPEQHVVAKIA